MQDLNSGSNTTSQSYCIRLIGDSEQFLTTFKGNIPVSDIQNILKTIQNHLYEDSGKIIAEYLMQHSLKYSNLHFETSNTNHREIMSIANKLLHHDSVSLIDEILNIAENYYATIDHQEFARMNIYEGCYFAIRKSTTSCNNICNYKIIGQTFISNASEEDPTGYFAIRSSNGASQLHDIQILQNPIIPVFGCIDVIGLLSEIDNIKTAKQALQIAIR